MIVFICGGSKSGKSSLGQNISKALSKGNNLYYLATMIPVDKEDKEKIRLHVEDRADMGFETIECGRNILKALDKADAKGTFLLDSITALLTNEMYGNFESEGIDKYAVFRCVKEVEDFSRSVANIVIVGDYIFSDAESYDESTELFRNNLAQIGNSVAHYADVVIEMSFGNITIHKGKDIYETIF